MVVDEIAEFIQESYPNLESGIVYCFSRKECELVCMIIVFLQHLTIHIFNVKCCPQECKRNAHISRVSFCLEFLRIVIMFSASLWCYALGSFKGVAIPVMQIFGSFLHLLVVFSYCSYFWFSSCTF